MVGKEAAVIGCLLLAGCVLPLEEAEGTSDGCLLERPTVALPALFVVNETGTHKWTYSSAAKRYVVGASVPGEGWSMRVETIPGSVFVLTPDRLSRHGNNLGMATEQRLGEFGAMTATATHVFVAGKGDLSVFDHDLDLVDRVGFQAGTHKTSHDAMVCGDRAYLLDNVVQPIYTYVVDARDAKDLRVVAEDEWEGLSHLHAQWLDDDARTWYIVENSGGMNWANQAIRVYSQDGGASKRRLQYYETNGYNAESNVEQGFRILGLVASDPPWFVVAEDGNAYLGRIQVGNNVAFQRSLDLRAAADVGYYGAAMALANETLVIVNGSSLRIVDLVPQPRLVLSQDLGQRTFDVAIEWSSTPS